MSIYGAMPFDRLPFFSPPAVGGLLFLSGASFYPDRLLERVVIAADFVVFLPRHKRGIRFVVLLENTRNGVLFRVTRRLGFPVKSLHLRVGKRARLFLAALTACLRAVCRVLGVGGYFPDSVG